MPVAEVEVWRQLLGDVLGRADRLVLPVAGDAVPVERLGLGFARQFAGVVLIEAEKQIYVGTATPALARSRVRRYVPVMRGLAAARDEIDATAVRPDRIGERSTVVPLAAANVERAGRKPKS